MDELPTGAAPVIDPKFSPDGSSRLRPRPRRVRLHLAARDAPHHRRQRRSDARPGRVRRPGGDGPLHRLLVVARSASTSPTRRPTPRASSLVRRRPDRTRARRRTRPSTRGRARPTSSVRLGVDPRRAAATTVWVDVGRARGTRTWRTVRWDKHGPLTLAVQTRDQQRAGPAARPTRRPARRRRC